MLLIGEQLLNGTDKSFHYVLTYRFSQDHVELLFSCIRARGGFNNNPNVLQFKTALKQIMMRNSIMSSNRANVVTFDETYTGSIFSFKSAKRKSPLLELTHEQDLDASLQDEEELSKIRVLFDSCNISPIQENILYYISGYVVRNIAKQVTCPQCLQLLYMPAELRDHPYAPRSYARLVMSKNRGGLAEASFMALKVIESSEKAFKLNVIHQDKNITKQDKIMKKMVIHILQAHDWRSYFYRLDAHGFEIEHGFQDDHKTQLIKRLAIKYLTIRLHTYAKRYTREIIHDKIPSKRHQLNKFTLFSNI